MLIMFIHRVISVIFGRGTRPGTRFAPKPTNHASQRNDAKCRHMPTSARLGSTISQASKRNSVQALALGQLKPTR
jgi:hypothetical protein